MNPRTLAVVAGVALVVGLAAADAFHGHGREPGGRRPSETAPGATRPAETAPVRGLPAAGTLVYTDARDCLVHEIVTGTGDEFPHPRLESDCRLTGAPVSGRIAFGVGGFGRTARFRFVDLVEVGERLRPQSGLFESILWSPDGQRAAWCRGTREAFELELLGGARRRLPRCPVAYLPSGRLAYVRGHAVVTGRTTVESERRPVVWAAWPANGRLFVVLDGGIARSTSAGTPVRIRGWTPDVRPVVSPDGCAALVARASRVQLLDSCRPWRGRFFRGTAAAWSPDGRWIAVADGPRIDFYDLRDTSRPAARWDRPAAALVWR